MATLTRRNINPFSNGNSYSTVAESEIEADSAFVDSAPHTADDPKLQTHRFVLKRGSHGIGFGFLPAKESIREMKLAGWTGTHLMHILAFAPEGGLHVADVISGSPAMEAGLQRFDVIQTVNDHDIRGWTAAEAITLIKSSEETVDLEILRHTDSMLREAEMQYDFVKDPFHKMRKSLMTFFKIQD